MCIFIVLSTGYLSGFQLIIKIARLDQRLTGFQGTYFATTYESDQSDVEKHRKLRYEPRPVDTFEISVFGGTSNQ